MERINRERKEEPNSEKLIINVVSFHVQICLLINISMCTVTRLNEA